MARKKKVGVVPLVIIVVIIVIAAVLVYGFVINQPHFGFPTASQMNSDTGKSYSQGNTTQTSSNSSLSSAVSVEGTNYHSSLSLIAILEAEFSNTSGATHAYVSFRGDGVFTSVTANVSYKSFTYSTVNMGLSEVTVGVDGKYVFVITSVGLTSSQQSLVAQTVIDSMTSFSI